MDTSNQIKIFDTTLRDGQQCPGAGMGFEENIKYAHLAAKVGVDVLEAGFPAASELDFEIVRTIANELSSLERSPIIASLCQLRDEQIDRTIEALAGAVSNKRARMHTYVPVDPNLMEASLGALAKDKKKIQQNVYEFIKRAVDAGLSVEFSPEGYSRLAENFDFVTDLFRAATEAGAIVFNCPDTIGGAYRLEGENYFVENIKKHAAIIDKEYPENKITWSVHCHNDFGLALENSLNGVFDGPARQIEGCFGGIGERAGNVALEQCIMVIKHFSEQQKDRLYTGIVAEHIGEICDFVAKHMLPRQPHFPITGKNAAKHSSGGHTNAVLKNPLVYQPFDPKEIGGEISLLFGPLSGGNHAKSIIEEAGYVCGDSEKADIAQYIKNLYKERRKGITDEELIKGYFHYRKPIKIKEVEYSRTSKGSTVEFDGEFFGEKGKFTNSHSGKDSALAALKGAIDAKIPNIAIESHTSESEGKGINANSVSKIVVSWDERGSYEGIGKDQDIEISAMKALLNAVNKAYVEVNYRKA